MDFMQTLPCGREGSRQQRSMVLGTPASYVLRTSLNAAGHLLGELPARNLGGALKS